MKIEWPKTGSAEKGMGGREVGKSVRVEEVKWMGDKEGTGKEEKEKRRGNKRTKENRWRGYTARKGGQMSGG